MRLVSIVANVTGAEPEAVFQVLSDFEAYPAATDAVRDVVITRESATKVASSWEVNFRSGILRWKEEDVFDREARTIHFTQIEGDLEHFSGSWHVDDHRDGCVVRFVAQFDMGIPTLAAMLDPIAENALRENVSNIISCLIDDPVQFVAAASE
jgi:ribosome-associated toxin RatA of RatAB toxin-antitoxin module